MADDGISVTPCNVFTSRRVFTNWFGKSASFLLSKSARPFTVPVVVSIWLSSVNSCPLAIFVCAVRSKASTVSLAFLLQASFNLAQTVFRYGENYGDGLQLRNDCEGYGSSRLHHVARIHQPQTHAAGDRSGDVAEVDLNLVILHRSLIVFYRALVLQHELFLVIQDLLCNGVARPRGAVAFKVHLRLGEHILVSLQRPLRLQERRAVRTRIDVNQRIALTVPADPP